MTHSKWLLLPAALIFLLPCLGQTQAQTQADYERIHLVSEEWEGSANADGTGLYWDIFRAVYQPEGINVVTEIVPYARSVHMVQHERADAWVAAYMDEQEQALYPRWHFDADIVMAVYRPESIDQWQGEQSLAGRRVGWIRGYRYDEYLDVEMAHTSVDDRTGGLRMLAAGRIEFFLDAKVELETAFEHNPHLAEQLTHSEVSRLNIYLAFADNERGRYFRDIFDRRLPQLLESGELRALYEKWDWPIWPFPDSP